MKTYQSGLPLLMASSNRNLIDQVEETLDELGIQPSDKNIDLFMCMGQSNMAGRGVAATAPIVTSGTAYEFRAISDPTKLYDIIEPFGVGENKAGGITEVGMKTGSMISAFAKSYYEITKTKAVYVSASKGGSSITLWQSGGAYLTDSVERFNAAKTWLTSNGYTVRHSYMLWCQGETDGDNSMGKYQYSTYLNSMISTMISAGIEKCLIIRIGNDRDYPAKYDNIMDVQTEYCKTHTNAVLVSTKLAEFADRGLMKDEFHYTQPAYNEAGYDAGYNCASYVKSGIAPTLNDYEYNNIYYPYAVNGDKKTIFNFDANNENGSVDVVACGTVSNGYIDTNTTHGYKKLLEPFKLNCMREWSIEFAIDPTQVVTSGSVQSGIMFIGEIASNKNYLFVNNTDGLIRLNDANSVNYDFTVASATLDAFHNYCITYNGLGSLSLYIDGTLSSTISATNITDIIINYMFGGYGDGSTYNSLFDYRGLCYYIRLINKALKTYQMNISQSSSVDKTSLISAINSATTNKNSVSISVDGSDISTSVQWVTQSVSDTYATAIATAQTVYNNASATQTNVDNAVTTLSSATTTFNNAKAYGTVAPAHTELSYLQSSGAQFINTGIIGKSGLKVEIKAQFLSPATSTQLFGSRTATGSNAFNLGVVSSCIRSDYLTLITASSSTVTVSTDYTIIKDNNTQSLNGTTFGSYTASVFDNALNMYLLSTNTNGTATVPTSAKCYYCKIWDAGVLVRDLIPVIKDSVYCMYDKVSATYFNNAGTGAFTGA